MHVDGACHCGRIRFTAEIDPDRVMVCHCSDCQVLSGAPFRTIVPAPVDGFRLQGTPKVYSKVAESGAVRLQAFCGDCATPLYATGVAGATQVMLRLGCVAQRAALPPKLALWQRSAAPWLAALCDLPGVATQLPPPMPVPPGP